MSVLRTFLAAVVAAAALVLAAPAPAFACSCVTADAAEFVTWADVVVVGEITEVTPPPQRELMSSGDPATYTVAVEEVLKGRSPATLDVLSAMSGASCGLENIEEGRDYVVLAGYHDTMGDQTDELWASLCGGTARASAAYVAEVEAVTGPGRPPPEPDDPAGDATVAADATITADATPASEPPAVATVIPGWAWGAGAGAALLGLGGIVVALRRRSLGG